MGLKNLLDVGMMVSRMKVNQWKSRCELESIQLEKLQRVLSNARGNVPHFKKALEGIRVQSLEDLCEIPIMEKKDVKLEPASFLHAGFREENLHRMRTGGSTGIPMTIFFNSPEGMYGTALRYHVLTECGFGPADRLAVLAHSRFVTTQFQRLIYRISPIPNNERPEKALSALKAMKPSMVFSYPSTLSILAGINAASAKPLRFAKAVSSSEMLTPKARAMISESFGCKIRNYYGSNESWSLAFECERGSMHINSDSVILEVADKDGLPVREGEKGDVLITSLWRHSMPFIRYRLGDIASLGGRCPCGRGLHILKSLEGRAVHMITLPSGRLLAWSQVAIRLGGLDGLLRYQVIQESRERLRILAIQSKDKPCSEKDIASLFDSILPEKMAIEVESVGEIPRTGAGKMQEFVSRLKPAESTAE